MAWGGPPPPLPQAAQAPPGFADQVRVGGRAGLFVPLIVASCSAAVAPVLGPDQIGQVSWRQAASQNIHS
jgi:hypothetical protein